MRLFTKSNCVWITLAVAILAGVVWLIFAWIPWDGFLDWLTVSKVDTESSSTTYSSESGSTTMRNVGLVIAGVVTVGLLIWRGYAANRQASAAQRQADIAQQQEEKAQQQVDIAQRQAETAQQGLRNERYQKGAEMLGSEVLSVRLGGIYALQRLARENPTEYKMQILRLFRAFVCHRTYDKHDRANMDTQVMGSDEVRQLREDVQAVMEAISKYEQRDIALERNEHFALDFTNAYLGYARLNDANLAWAILWKANLYNSILWKADLSNAILKESNLSRCDLKEAVLLNADLREAELSGAKLMGTKLNDAKIEDADLSKAKLWGGDLSNANLNNANLSSTDLWVAKLPNAFLNGSNLTRAKINKSNLSNAKLAEAKLSYARIQASNFSQANLRGANLSSAKFKDSDLSNAELWGANLSKASLKDTNLSGANLAGGVTGLTQGQLDEARADINNPPDLKGVRDAETGKPLVWSGGQGEPLEDEG